MSVFRTTSHPFPHLVEGDLFPADLMCAANESWPAPSWDGWYGYGPARGSKAVSDPHVTLPPPCAALLYRMALLPLGEWLGVPGAVPDLGLWGAGLHDLPPGGVLPAHLDAETHPRLGLRRAISAVLYVHRLWDDAWGGALELMTTGGVTAASIAACPGRLVAFANVPDAYHAVAPVTGPRARRALALFWYCAPAGAGRQRALFGGPPVV